MARGLRRLGGRRAKIVHFADDVAKAFDALFLQRGPPAQQPLARTGQHRGPSGARQIGRGRTGAVPPRRPGSAANLRSPFGRGGRRGGCARLRSLLCSRFVARLARRFRLDLADRLFERKALLGDIRLRERRLVGAQLRDQRVARPFVKRPASLPGAPVQPLHGAGDERMIVGHRLSLRSVAAIFTRFMSRTDSASGLCLRVPDWSTRRLRDSLSVPPIGGRI